MESEAMFETLNEPIVWLMIVVTVLTVFVARYWSHPVTASVQQKLREAEDQVAKLQKAAEVFGRTVREIEAKFEKQIETISGKVAHLSGDVGEVRREAHDIDKHVDSLEMKTDVAATKVEAVKHQVDVEVGELKRIDDQVKDSLGKVKTNALHIQYLEDEVRGLARELSIVPVRARRDRHVE
jgi:chromosome segregation ATPase